LTKLTLLADDFDARGPDELTLRRGEKIELVELDDGFGDGWYLGKDLNTGTTGLFPGGSAPEVAYFTEDLSLTNTCH
jgi:hypothetical protein